MKTLIRAWGIIALTAIVFCSTSCSKRSHAQSTVIISNKSTSLPPGQAKKLYGETSAREFAPGQQKKKGNNTVVVKN
jgi:hypothetical protein